MPVRKPTSKTAALKVNAATSQADAKAQLDSFLDKYDPEVAAFARRALAKMRKLVPGAIEMVYDNYNALAIGFGPSERASEAIFSIALYPGRVRLFFLQGAGMPDPAKRLEGSARVVRSLRLFDLEKPGAGEPDGKLFDDLEIRDLINVALNRAKVSIPRGAKRRLVIKSISAKQRPRRASKKA